MLLKPFGFAGAGGVVEQWDATLDGALTIHYWWDFTSLDYVSVDGSNQVTSVTPVQKPDADNGDASLRKLNSGQGPTFTNYPTWDTNLKAVKLENACMVSASDNINLDWDMQGASQENNFTMVTIFSNDNWQSGVTNSDGISACSIRNQSFNNYVTFCSDAAKGGTSNCSGSGDFYVGLANYDTDWGDGRNQQMSQNPSGSAGYLPNMVTSYWNGANNGDSSKITINNHEYCTLNLDDSSESGTVPGLVIGAAPGLNGTVSMSGGYFHHVVYSGELSQTQTDDLYASWVSHYLG